MEQAYSKDLKVVGTSSEIRKAMAERKIALLPILEGATRLKNDPALLRTYYKLGLRSVTLAYKTNDLDLVQKEIPFPIPIQEMY